jgi:protein SCO1/2
MKHRHVIPLAALIAAALVVATGKLTPRLRPSLPITPAAATSVAGSSGARPVLFDVPDFSLTDQDNKPFSPRDLRGKIWIADFIFTGCAGACPLLSEKLSQLQQQIADPRVHFVSFDVDPDRDTPAMLKAYGAKYKADFSRWHFLASPSRAAAFSIARGLHVTDQPDDRNYQILHSDRLILIDAAGKVCAVFDSTKGDSLNQLRSAAANLLDK